MTAATCVIDIKGLSVSYGNKRVLTNLFLKIPKGSICGVVGPNGAGKSTLFKAILGLTPINTGKILLDNRHVDEVRSELAYVPQKDRIDVTFPATVWDVVMMGRYARKPLLEPINRNDRGIVLDAMKSLAIEDLKHRQIGALSGGQQQRVFIARALAQEANLFFLDEPFVGVDMITEEKIMDLLKTLRQQGKTTLVVHHDLSSVSSYFDHVVLLNQRLVAFGETKDVFIPKLISKTYGAQLDVLHSPNY